MTSRNVVTTGASVDFLPGRFREQDAQRKVQTWRVISIGLLALVLPVVSFVQMRIRRHVEAEMTKLAPRYTATELATAQLRAEEAKLRRTEATAQLLAYLHHPWPRSQVLGALLPPLPDSITFSSIQIETVGPAAALQPMNNPHQEIQQADAAAALPAQRDLKTLRGRFDNARTEVIITGLAGETVQLHNYLGELSRNRLFVKAELVSLESVTAVGPRATETTKGARFKVRLALCPGYGLPHGPQIAAASPAAVSSDRRFPETEVTHAQP